MEKFRLNIFWLKGRKSHPHDPPFSARRWQLIARGLQSVRLPEEFPLCQRSCFPGAGHGDRLVPVIGRGTFGEVIQEEPVRVLGMNIGSLQELIRRRQRKNLGVDLPFVNKRPYRSVSSAAAAFSRR